jgi:hypothetical protein
MTLYQPSMPEAARKDFKSYSEYNGYMSMQPAHGVFVQLAAEGGITQSPRLVMTIFLDKEASMRWISAIALVSDLQGKNQHSVRIGQLGFRNYCGPPPKRICSISDINLVDGPVEIKKYQRGTGEWDRTETIHVATGPTNRIRGTRLITEQVMLSGKEHWLKVDVPLAIDEGYPDLRELILALPPLEINGQKTDFPPIKILQQKQTIYSPLKFF